MRKLFITLLFLAPVSALADGNHKCTEEPKAKWQNEKEFQKKLVEQGYEIKKFKVLDYCYEIYGKNKEGKKVEIYFNPVTAAVFKEEVD